ncbi:hypothetical protein WP2_24 [Lactococcus phage WP-2]|uniref:Uncharacterized protein n=1 Tax=Lactococcus phage WP-2 TaxID=1486423 RepID=A0A024B3U1_9CAUD|nr:hypothetical protein WP2_24 [Lactococcus phage WP-2]AHZ10896.1 hypothetical protein WP2_24 [Lactococcus phage WP-2]
MGTTNQQITEMPVRHFPDSQRFDNGQGMSRLDMSKQYKSTMSIQPSAGDSYTRAIHNPRG